MIGETGWDVLLALNAKGSSGVSLHKLAPLVSIPKTVLGEWLDWLEDRQLVANRWHGFTDQLDVFITGAGSELVHNYLLATSSRQSGTRH